MHQLYCTILAITAINTYNNGNGYIATIIIKLYSTSNLAIFCSRGKGRDIDEFFGGLRCKKVLNVNKYKAWHSITNSTIQSIHK